MLKSIRCAVGCANASGSPDFFFCRVEGTVEDIEQGYHYRAAMRAAKDALYELLPACSFCVDEQDEGWKWIDEKMLKYWLGAVWPPVTIIEEDRS